MYLDFFGLHSQPFRLTPDPAFLYYSRQHEDGLAHLLYALERGSGGFACITGEVGTGKTTLCRAVMERLPEHVTCALILNSLLTAKQLLAAIAHELGMKPKGDRRQLHEQINQYLLEAYAAGHRVVVIIDEAQNLDFEALEQLRLLTNLETGEDKLMQIILLGQPELRRKLDSHELRQLKQRVTVRFHLKPLSAGESGAYVEHRLCQAGAQRSLFSKFAMRRLVRVAGGIPRRLNVLADRSLLAAFVNGRVRVGWQDVGRALGELDQSTQRGKRWSVFAVSLVGLAVLGVWLVSLAPQSTTNVDLPIKGESPERWPPSASLSEVSNMSADDAAFASLLDQWGVSSAQTEPPAPGNCDRWQHERLRCASGRLTLDALLAVDRPAVVQLDQHWHLLHRVRGIALVGQSPSLTLPQNRLGETVRFVSLMEIPNSIPEQLIAGDRGPEVAWLGSLVDQALGLGDLARLRDRLESGMLSDINALREAVGLPASARIGRNDYWLATGVAKVPEQPSMVIEQDLE
jgi:general secretion pathway protein A